MKKALYIVIAVFSMNLVSCNKFLDINVDPNAPSGDNVTTSMILPAAEMSLATSYGDYLRIVGGYFSQHYCQEFGTSNYLDYSKFTMSGARNSTTWTQLYQKGLKSCSDICEKAQAEGDWNTNLAAVTLRAFIYQVLVDAYGEVPYTEAMNIENVNPKYDDGETVYAGIAAELEEAISKASPTGSVATNFLFPGETAESWIEFANALLLKIYTRECGVVDVKSKLADLISENNFPGADVEFKDCWAEETGKENPFWGEEWSTLGGSTQINVIANIAIIGTMQQSGFTDGRLEKFFVPNENGDFTGGISGSNFSKSKLYKAAYWCRPTASYDMPLSLISLSEIEFFKAEYQARYGSASDAKAAYEAAIKASFDSAGADGADAVIAKYPYNSSSWKECIGIAKWVALSGINNFESWCEMRRLGYPTFGAIKGTDLFDDTDDSTYNPGAYVPGTLYTPIKVYDKVGENKLLARFPYAESSTSRNSNIPEFPGFTVPVFWAE